MVRRRIIDAPADEWITADQFAAWLGVPSNVFAAMEKAGIIPPAKKWTGKTKVWHWEIALTVSLALKHGLIGPGNLAPTSDDDG